VGALAFHAGEVGLAYGAVILSARGGTPPYSWGITAGSLPAGLGLSSGGSLTGTPTAASHPGFTVTVQDSVGASASANSSINVFAHLAVTAPCVSQCNVEDGCSACGSFGTVGGGAPPYAYRVVQGSAPAGTTYSGGLAVTGTFQSGGSGAYALSVQVTDQLGVQARVDANWFVFPHIALDSGTCSGGFGSGCTVQLAYTGGTPNATPSVRIVSVAQNLNQGCWAPATTTPPPGYGLSTANGFVTVTIPGNISNGYGAVWTLAITDQSRCTQTSNCESSPATVTIGVQCS
jgi:hypothetical protein